MTVQDEGFTPPDELARIRAFLDKHATTFGLRAGEETADAVVRILTDVFALQGAECFTLGCKAPVTKTVIVEGTAHALHEIRGRAQAGYQPGIRKIMRCCEGCAELQATHWRAKRLSVTTTPYQAPEAKVS